MHSTNDIFNAPKLLAVQGRVIAGGLTELGLILKGRRTQGIALNATDLVDAVPGWGDNAVNQLRARCTASALCCPTRPSPTPDTIAAFPNRPAAPSPRPAPPSCSPQPRCRARTASTVACGSSATAPPTPATTSSTVSCSPRPPGSKVRTAASSPANWPATLRSCPRPPPSPMPTPSTWPTAATPPTPPAATSTRWPGSPFLRPRRLPPDTHLPGLRSARPAPFRPRFRARGAGAAPCPPPAERNSPPVGPGRPAVPGRGLHDLDPPEAVSVLPPWLCSSSRPAARNVDVRPTPSGQPSCVADLRSQQPARPSPPHTTQYPRSNP